MSSPATTASYDMAFNWLIVRLAKPSTEPEQKSTVPGVPATWLFNKSSLRKLFFLKANHTPLRFPGFCLVTATIHTAKKKVTAILLTVSEASRPPQSEEAHEWVQHLVPLEPRSSVLFCSLWLFEVSSLLRLAMLFFKMFYFCPFSLPGQCPLTGWVHRRGMNKSELQVCLQDP